MCSHDLALRHRRRVNVDHRIRKHTTRYVFEDTWLEYVDAGEHQRRLTAAVRDGHATEPRDSSGFSLNNTEALTTSVRQKNECRNGVCFAMCLDRGIQIDVSNDLPVDDDKRILLEERARVVERATRAEYHGLLNIMKLHTETTTIAERASHRLRTMMQVHHDLIDAIAGEIFGDITDKRLSQDRYRGFGAV